MRARNLLVAAFLLAPGVAWGQVSGAPNPLPVTDPATLAISGKLPASGNGTDSTVTAPAALTNLATFTVSNPGAYRIQNQSAATIQYQLCATGGTGCSTFLLAPGAGANAQGADSSPEVTWFTGVINVLGATGAQFAARHN